MKKPKYDIGTLLTATSIKTGEETEQTVLIVLYNIERKNYWYGVSDPGSDNFAFSHFEHELKNSSKWETVQMAEKLVLEPETQIQWMCEDDIVLDEITLVEYEIRKEIGL